ncbi:hypothetical protein L0222_20895 [bacterium]|nr:hypothetical protein [bacterium]
MIHFRKAFYLNIFLIAASTLLLEISLSKIFSVIYYHHFAFLIISTALFGYGLSGVFLSVSKWVKRTSPDHLLYVSTILFAFTTVVSYRLILLIPLKYETLLLERIQILYLATVYLLVALPFFFSGLSIGGLLATFNSYVSKLYFADLAGAAIGCFAIILTLPGFGGSGTVLVCGIVACLAALGFASSRKKAILPVLLIILYAFLIPGSEHYFPTATKSPKRQFTESIQRVDSYYTEWSPAARIDVVGGIIWIDGGTNQSGMRRIPPKEKFDRTPPEFPFRIIEVPYNFVTSPDLLIIGPGGGAEVAQALPYRSKSITGVELDPVISKLMLGMFSRYIGNIYTRPGVQLINEEGRSYLRRSQQKYDIIQQKANSHPMAVASGALNLTETYLLTKEAFHEYLDHLKPNGFLSIERHRGLRLLNLGAEVLLERGVKDYWNYMALFHAGTGDVPGNYFLLKNTPFTSEELDYLHKYAERMGKSRGYWLLYSPRMQKETLFTDFMRPGQREQMIKEAPYELRAPSDDWPFIEHSFFLKSLFSFELRKKIENPFWQEADIIRMNARGILSAISIYIILLEALVLATVFLIYPLVRSKPLGIHTKETWRLLIYFFCLGVGFIFVEIALIQKYILFIGYPVYSVAAIVFSLLLAAALGSLYTNRSSNVSRSLKFAVAFICASILFQVLLAPILFQKFLSAPFAARMALSVIFIFPAGFFMGMPFPLALSWMSRHLQSFVPWAWGMNGYATVLGSVLSVILALNFGFRSVLITAGLIYIAAYLCIRPAIQR